MRAVRVFNPYGPRMAPKDVLVVSNFIVNALGGWRLELCGGGVQARSFCCCTDPVEDFFRLMRHDAPLDGPMNIETP